MLGFKSLEMGWVFLCALVSVGGIGCSDAPASCPPQNMIAGVCAGISIDEVCANDVCTSGITCSNVIQVANNSQLSAAASTATAGSCITLAPGTYATTTLAGGVSLLGRSAAEVSITGVTLGAGSGATIRGIAVGSDGVVLASGAVGVHLTSIRISSSGDGLTCQAGSSVTLEKSEITGAGRANLFVQDADVTIQDSIIANSEGPGIWMEGSGCDAACACTNRPHLTIENTVIRDNRVLGISLRAAVASMTNVDVTGTKSGKSFMTGQLGGGIVAAACSDLSGKHLRVLDSADFGVLLDKSTAKLGDALDPQSFESSRNLRGLWTQNVDCADPIGAPCVEVHNATFAENYGVGVGVGGQTRGFIFCKSRIEGTQSATLPVFDVNQFGTTQIVGDGFNWLDGSSVVIEASTLSGNARQSLLIDGEAMGSIMSLLLEGGDENHPPLQQNLPMGGAQPAVWNGVTLAKDTVRQFAIPQPPTTPASL